MNRARGFMADLCPRRPQKWSSIQQSAKCAHERGKTMRWSWRIARIAGIDLYVHVTFLILVGWVALSHYLARQSPADAFTGVAFIFSLFAIVVLHELGHALTARRFGIPTRDITLLPIGGVAR